jgi:microcystin-dependent protein
MSEPFLAEIRMFAGNFAPRGFAMCNGQILAISQNAALFSLLGTTFGGDGISNFGLPNMQGNVPVHFGQGPGLSDYVEGQTGGSAAVTLLLNEMGQHNHPVACSDQQADQSSPGGFVWAVEPTGLVNPYVNAAPNVQMANALGNAGGGQPHNNMMPYLVVNFIIALQGVFPARN